MDYDSPSVALSSKVDVRNRMTWRNACGGFSQSVALDADLGRAQQWLTRAQLQAKVPDSGSRPRTRDPFRYRRRHLSHCRQTLAVSAADHRALRGDTVAARRLAWRAKIIEARCHVKWLLERLKAHELKAAKFNDGCCGPCSDQLALARRSVSVFLDEIAAMAGQAPTFADYRQTFAIPVDRGNVIDLDARRRLRR